MSSKLLDRTRELLESSELTVLEIHHQSGLSLHWLNQMKYSKNKVDPSVTKTEKLYEFLSGKSLGV